MHFLNEGFRDDQVMIDSTNHRTIQGIKNARMAPNGRANLFTVSDAARLLANTVAQMRQQHQDFTNDQDGGE